MRVSPSTYVEAAGSSRAEARRRLSPQTVLDKIMNFLTFGGRTRQGLKDMGLLQDSIHAKLSELPRGQAFPAQITFNFLGQQVTLVETSEGKTSVKVATNDGSKEPEAVLETLYKDVLLKAKLKHETPAKLMDTEQSQRATGSDINRDLMALLE